MKKDFSFLGNAKTVAVVCNQWGDTGKGKIIDFLTPWADIVARGTGGANAGHTICYQGREFVTHLLPSSIFHDCDGKISIIGSGVAFDPRQCLEELGALQEAGYPSRQLRISRHSKLVLPQHILLDQLSGIRKDSDAIGTTGRGIGPAYADYYNRCSLFVGDLFHRDTFVKKLRLNLEEKIARLRAYDHHLVEQICRQQRLGNGAYFHPDSMLDPEAIVEDYTGFFADQLREYVTDTTEIMRASLGKKRILLEGAQGYLLSIEYGSYPYVTSSDCSIEGLAKGVGLNVGDVDLTFGAVKAFYMTRVGKGAFPTECGGLVSDEHCGQITREQEKAEYSRVNVNDPDSLRQGIAIRMRGNEYGATTGRPRRVGWLDLALLRQALRVNGNDIILTKVDVLDECEEIKLCTAYRYAGEQFFLGRDTIKHGEQFFTVFPDNAFLKSCEPVYQSFPGWLTSTSGLRSYADLPKNMRAIIEYIERETGAVVRMVSVGPDREQTIIR
ncbi:adenylosuccinate synthase [Candidatus Uhrbacteria bacterium]|nr:adenylosuccinate synthase [Candidatus Uhrbacteria bacterium]